jgi:hypothetical protein
VLSAGALALPSSASAWEEPFCVFVWVAPGSECFAQNLHTLQAVRGVSGGWDRMCVASYTHPWGTQNSNWRCGYNDVTKYIDGRVDGVGVVHNGEPYWIGIVGFQYF